jgi:hypothetical protein
MFVVHCIWGTGEGSWLLEKAWKSVDEGISRLFAKVSMPRGPICRGGARMTDTGDMARTHQSVSGGAS